MANFDEILANLHENAILIDTEKTMPIRITSNRTFEIPQGYNTVLAYAGDVNSQIVTFELPRYHEGHDLFMCSNKKLKWKNKESGVEGSSQLIPKESEETRWLAAWEVPPELMTIAGKLEIAISLYDIVNNIIVFSWNTAECDAFSIGEGFNKVSDILTDGFLPAKEEILNIDIENKTIIAPEGYNFIVCNYGEIGVSKVFFEINQVVRGIDLLDENTEIQISTFFNGEFIKESILDREKNIKPIFQTQENKKTNRMLLIWDVPKEVTDNTQGYTGKFSIALKIVAMENGEIGRRWVASEFSKLIIGTSMMLKENQQIF